MTIYKVPVRRSDGSIAHVAVDGGDTLTVLDSDGTTEITVDFDPTGLPPTARPFVLDSDGTTRIYIDWAEAVYSMDLTTLTRVKSTLGGFSTSAYDSLIGQIISDVSSRFERYMRRQVLRTTNTKTFPLAQLSTVVTLDAAPVSSITSIKYASHPSDFAGTTAMSSDLYVLEDSAAGLVRFLIEMPLNDRRRPGYVQVVYVGGMADDTADFVATYPDIARAADIQCAYEYNRRNTPGGNVTSDAGSTAFDEALGMLESSKQALAGHRRVFLR